ncbi:protein-export membrane protein SecF [Candidatus Daviesbacteria bacterium RIFCSPHIGHO2_01_FULL_44_29]|uniref:Protein-export membrane protein SecF n=1 Tax=Candidatus Daviesbacteria bacterium RIFCSPHIGHO2_02_FULL_43_12 TaxID=1797776 RepID=A0A1F5KGD9_9BACT|nr:MAG: protein-export membrane protein SecF [Candidatus Daviesbacteria bacterium RIFCSPHIGHO2_01_FULL_44_29]OGE39904.1 MAG: protein-export membrane protein SecF [Candidatus Daviesbacteria bacterium RIFCSPHIGHO2_02_FULL_43_12]OGE40538.1 MAG: protein-export membrane protein SecF [Candidatus Daviesbacteria bacterium RIFCSPHIGHO2_12_FULL_47_45]OGE70415.1 MAG: protein-export membrane protein SecF [Candidatus Daviesbacteria bacterium RIFCSPLOWO2_01_FULL_43_15]
MLHLMRRKLLFFILSSLVILPGLFFLLTGGLKFGIDFTGGSLLEYKFEKTITKEELQQYGTVTKTGDNAFIIRTKPQDHNQLNTLKKELSDKYGKFEASREENVGPIIGAELKQKAVVGTMVACLMIILYITYSFRKVPKPASSFRFGIAAVVALIHDVLVLVGVFAIFGKFLHVEIDTLFVTALLTVIGFSVHDTIVVFDRIRENMPKHLNVKFSDIADISIVQTLARSLNTSLTVVIVLLALVLFGGESIRWFVVALLIGIISGTYSSIFNATALLCWWEEKLGH